MNRYHELAILKQNTSKGSHSQGMFNTCRPYTEFINTLLMGVSSLSQFRSLMLSIQIRIYTLAAPTCFQSITQPPSIDLLTDIYIAHPFNTHRSISQLSVMFLIPNIFPTALSSFNAAINVNLFDRSAALVAGLFVNIKRPPRKNICGAEGN